MSNGANDNYLKKELYELIKTDESIFDFIQESSLDGLWYWDVENPENEWMNPKFWTVLGYNPKEMPHKSNAWQSIINQDDLKTALENFKKHCEDPSHPYDQIVRYTHKNGSTVWIHCRGMAIRDKDGKPYRMLGAHHDISKLIDIEQKLFETNLKIKKTDEIYKNVIESLPIGMFIYQYIEPNELYLLQGNQSAEKLTGLKINDWIGKEFNDIWPNAKKQGITDSYLSVARTGIGIDLEDTYYEDERVSGAFRIYAFKFDDDKIAIAFLNVTEIKKVEQKLNLLNTDLRQAKESAEHSEEKYRALYNNAPLSYQSLDENGCFIDINPMWLKTLGYERDEVIGKWYGDFLHPDFVEHFNINFPAFKKRGYVSDVQFKLRKKDNTYIDVSFEGCIGYTPEGKFRQTYCVFKDITDQKALELHLIKAKEKAEESDRLKTAFLQNMSHEIRTPMNAIMGFSSLLASNFNNKEKLENFSRIIDLRCNDLLDIINDVLDISKIESGQSTISLEPCNINELFDELNLFFKDYKGRLNKQHINLFFQTSPEESLRIINTDKLKLKQVLINLISNALKFTETGSIKCGYKLEKGKLLFHVSDTGIGIQADQFDYIFERFSQLKHPTLQNVGGTGLGLSIVKGLVKLLGGNVWLESESNKGTTFYFTIDYLIADSTTDNKNTLELKQELITNKTILIVEDDFYNAEYLKEALNNVTSNIVTVSQGFSAVKIVQEQKIDLILMDIRLPDMSGYEATRMILQDNPKMKIIAQTAYAANTEHQKAMEAGCVDYLSKPTKQEQLLTVVKKYLK